MAELEPKVLTFLPFVDGAPDVDERPDQKSIEWIVAGECLGAAQYVGDNKGELNRAGVEIQSNAKTLFDNEVILNSSIGEVITRVNAHDVVLGEIGDDNLANKVGELSNDVGILAVDVATNEQNVQANTQNIAINAKSIGFKPVGDTSTRDILQDLYWVKETVGSYSDYDSSGTSTPGSTPTGLVSKVLFSGLKIDNNTRRIEVLEKEFQDSDVEHLKADIDQIRNEIGPTASAPELGVYNWIFDATVKHDTFETQIEKLIHDIGDQPESLDERIEANTAAINLNKSFLADDDIRITDLQTRIGDSTIPTSMEYRLGTTETRLADAETIIGFTPDSGLRGVTSVISTEIGDDDTPDSLKGRMAGIDAKQLVIDTTIAAIDAKVGSNTEGEESGLFKDIKDLEQIIANVVESLIGKIDEAPEDGKLYVRANGAWVSL